MSASNRSGWDALAWAAAFADGRARPRDLLEHCLKRIERHDSVLGICNHVAERRTLLDQAAASLGRWQGKTPLSPLDGIPFGVKANVAVQGFPWHGGIAAFRARRAAADAECVARLRAAGMIPMAVFNMHEAALGETTHNPAFAITRNPRDPNRIPGGSSGGSAAAVAAGFAPIALGTDDLGSVRLPSALCGVVGFKPGRGEISTSGVIPLCRRLDHVGVHGRSVRDVAAVAGICWQDGHPPDDGWAIGGQPETGKTPESRSPPTNETDGTTSRQPETGKTGLVRWSVTIERPATQDILRAFDRLAAERGLTRRIDWTDIDLPAVRRAGLLMCERDGAELFASALRRQPDGFSPTFRRLVEWGAAQPLDKVRRAERLLAETSARLRTDLGAHLLISPTTMHVAPLVGDPIPTGLADLTAPAAIAGVPAISVPMGTPGRGPSMGLQIVGLDSIAVLGAAEVFFPSVVP